MYLLEVSLQELSLISGLLLMTKSYSISYNGQPVKVIFKAHIGHLCPELHAMAKMANMYHIGRATTNILTLLVQGSTNSVTLHFKKSEFQTSLRVAYSLREL